MKSVIGTATHPDSDGAAAGVSQELAAWAANVTIRDMPQRIRQAARWLTLDGLGCGLLGSTTPWGGLVAQAALAAGSDPEATVWGSTDRATAVNAALANGTFIHSFEYDDLHPRAVLHGTSNVLPAALAVAELRNPRAAAGPAAASLAASLPLVTSDELLAAVVVGLEVGARIGVASGPAQLARGFHPSPNTGTMAAAAAAGRLLRLDEAQMRDALGIAGSFGGSLMAAQYGAMVKRVHAGHAAQSGVLGAYMARLGISGIREILEAPYGGFLHAYAGNAAGSGQIVAGLGDRWEVDAYTLKRYPCCGSSHSSLDAYASILDEAPEITASEIDRITVECSTLTFDHVGWEYAGGGVTAAQMNLSYALAAMVVDGRLEANEFAAERLEDPSILAVIRKIRITPSEQIDGLGPDGRHAVKLTVRRSDGSSYQRTIERSKRLTPTSEDGQLLIDKYRGNARIVLDETALLALEESVLHLGDDRRTANPVSEILNAMGTSPERASKNLS